MVRRSPAVLVLVAALAAACAGSSQVGDDLALTTSSTSAIYLDALQGDWQDWSWTTHSLAATSPVSAGTRSISVTFGAWSGLSFNSATGFTPDASATLEFDVNGGTSGGQVIAASGVSGGTWSSQAPVAKYCAGGVIPAGKFVHCAVPFSALGLTGKKVSRIALSESQGKSLPKLYVDQLVIKTTTTTVAPAIAVTITPATATVAASATQAFSAAVTNTSTTTVTWKVSEAGGGAVSTAGLYTAPATAGTYHVVATSTADETKSATATVTVTAASGGGGGTGGGTVVPPGQVTGDVVLSIDSRTTKAISPLIYGLNFAEHGGAAAKAGTVADLWGSYLPKYTLNRFGGNRTTSHNWETGYSNCGSDCGSGFPNDKNLLDNISASPGVGSSLKPRLDTTFSAGASFLLTAPVIGYVSKDASGNQAIPAAADANTPATPSSTHWLQALPQNPAGATATPNTADGYTYTDDLVKWVDTQYPAAKTDPTKTVQFELDNEPDIWSGTHQEIRGKVAGGANSGQVPTGFDELVSKTAAHARAVKAVTPSAMVWAGGFAGFDGLTQLNYDAHPNGPPAGYTYYLDYYLKGLAAAAGTGPRLVDVVDVHWYVQDGSITNDDGAQDAATVQAREQAPRSLWDPKYIENSWVTYSVPAGDPLTQNCNSGGACPMQIVPRVQSRIASYYPGTKLAIGEYWYGRGGDISSTITNADVLGIFGREGVYAATMWPNASNIWAYNTAAGCNGDELCSATHAYQCALRAIDVYRNYDGAGGRFGDNAIALTRTDAAFTSPATQNERVTAYASMDADHRRVVVVAINKTASSSLNTGLALTHDVTFSHAEVYRVTGANGGAGGCTAPVRQADVPLTLTNAFNATLPPQSVTVFVLKP